MRARCLVAILAAALAAQCKGKSKADDCLTFELMEGRANVPSNVMLFFGVKTCGGDPLPGLLADEFVIEEDGSPISIYESRQTILPTSLGFDLVSVLLLDMSGSIIDSGNLPALQGAANAFVDRLAGAQRVAIFTFDGRADLQPLVDFTTDDAALHAGIDSLSGYTPVDPSTNLNGAVVEGIGILDAQVAASTAAIVAGSLVVFTDGSDQAGRVPAGTAIAAAGSTQHSVFAIGLGGEVDRDYLEDIGHDGAEFASDAAGVAEAFESIADRIDRESRKFYILAYCSPKRSGTHQLTLSVEGRSGSLAFSFDATGFGPGCDPGTIVDASTDAPVDTIADVPVDTIADVPVDDGSGVYAGCWVDPTSGLVWEDPPMAGMLTWDSAVSYCSSLSLDGHGAGEWHLPTISELRTLIRGCAATEDGGACGVTDACLDSSCQGPECYECSYLGGPGAGGCYWDPALEGACSAYWSSSSHAADPSFAWFVHFDFAFVVSGGKVFDRYVRCVRPGP